MPALTLSPVCRIHWLRARAQRARWREEFTLTGYEMQWTVKYFDFQSEMWENRGIVAEHGGRRGATAYAARKAAMWHSLAENAAARFKAVNSQYIRLVT